jgi:hypothetical protein
VTRELVPARNILKGFQPKFHIALFGEIYIFQEITENLPCTFSTAGEKVKAEKAAEGEKFV